jgi:hypothetical protein
MEEIVKEVVLDQDNPGITGEHADPPPAQEEPQAPPESIPYARFTEVNTQKKEALTQVEERDRQLAEQKQQIDLLTQQLMIKAKTIPETVAEQPKELTEPNPEDYKDGEYDKAYLADFSKHQYAILRQQEQQEAQKRALQQDFITATEQHRMREQEYAKTNADYVTNVISNPLFQHYAGQLPAHIQAEIMKNPQSHLITNHLGANIPSLVQIVNSKVPGIELGKIISKISAEPAVKKVSVAPDPIDPVGKSNMAIEKTPQQMTYEEWKVKQNKRETERRKAGTYGR